MNETQFRRSLLNTITVLLLVLSVPSFAEELGDGTGADWPQWRGPNRDGVSPEKGLLESWPESGPKLVWRIPGGAGFSGISVSEGKLYTMWDQEDAQYLVCLNASTAKELWRRRLGPAFFNSYGDGPRASPVVDTDRVFAISAQGKLLALNHEDGRLVWMHDLASEYNANPPAYSYASSPIVLGGRLFAETGAQDGTFMAFDKKSGDLIWSAEQDVPAYSSPIVMSVAALTRLCFGAQPVCMLSLAPMVSLYGNFLGPRSVPPPECR